MGTPKALRNNPQNENTIKKNSCVKKSQNKNEEAAIQHEMTLKNNIETT